MAKPNKKAPLGQGGRFAAMKAMAARQGAKSPGGLAAYIGRKAHGKQTMAMLARAGKREA